MQSYKMEFNPNNIESKWQSTWTNNKTYQTEENSDKPKYYVLDMFPYPSGAGLHVGHPLGYIASDIVARYKRLKGFNVLHPMGFDAFGLPAEQYAIETGQHPAKTTEENIARYKSQLNNLGLSFDWSREVVTSDPAYYQWTQWIFCQLFESWYNTQSDRAESLEALVSHFEQEGNKGVSASTSFEGSFTAVEVGKLQFRRKRQHTQYLPLSLFKLCRSKLVPCTRHRTCQRRSKGRSIGTRQPSRREEKDAPMVFAYYSLFRTLIGWLEQGRMAQFAQGNATQLDRPIGKEQWSIFPLKTLQKTYRFLPHAPILFLVLLF